MNSWGWQWEVQKVISILLPYPFLCFFFSFLHCLFFYIASFHVVWFPSGSSPPIFWANTGYLVTRASHLLPLRGEYASCDIIHWVFFIGSKLPKSGATWPWLKIKIKKKWAGQWSGGSYWSLLHTSFSPSQNSGFFFNFYKIDFETNRVNCISPSWYKINCSVLMDKVVHISSFLPGLFFTER